MSANVVQQGAGVRIFYYCSHPVVSKVRQANGIPKLRSVIDKLLFFLCSNITHTWCLSPGNVISISHAFMGM